MQNNISNYPLTDLVSLTSDIKIWSRELGFQETGISDAKAEKSHVERGLLAWLNEGYHGNMDYMAKHGIKRSHPDKLIPGTLRVISVRMNYSPPKTKNSWQVIEDSEKAFISRYALGRDYHKVLRGRLQKLADKITAQIGHCNSVSYTHLTLPTICSV